MLEIVNNICFIILAGMLNYSSYKQDGKLTIYTGAMLLCIIALIICLIIRIIYLF